ncbi:MAG: alpha/beta hydrolase [Candidatus Daviesbacteria bacterium]|nr:alpha/beta hydrolase [Candidatus Daviesbacteria bacterium]
MSKILILHGWTYSTEKWGPFLNLLKEKGADAELLKIPGLTEKLESVWNINNYVEWLKEKAGKNRVVLVGHSNGGRIILAFAAKYPNKIKNIVLIDCAGIYHNDLPIRLKRLVFKTLAKAGRKITTSAILRKFLYKLSRESDYEKASPIVKQTMKNLITFDITPNLSKVKIPTLIIWGRQDKTTPLSDGKTMHQLLSNSKLEVIEDAKHSPQFTHPEEVTKIIYEYI